MLNFLNFSFNYIDVVCFFAIYFLLATYFGNKIFYASKMQHIEYTYSVICILAITICANPFSSLHIRLTGTNQIMLILMLITFLVLTIKAVLHNLPAIQSNQCNDEYNNIYNKTFRFPVSRLATNHLDRNMEQEYENIYSTTPSNNTITTQETNIQDNVCLDKQNNNQATTDTQIDDVKLQLSHLQQQINSIQNEEQQPQQTTNNHEMAQHISIIEGKIVILADKIHNMEKQTIEKQQQDIENIKCQLSQQNNDSKAQLVQVEQIAQSIITKQQAPIVQQLNELRDDIGYLQNALQNTIDRIAKVFALFKRIIKNYNTTNYA